MSSPTTASTVTGNNVDRTHSGQRRVWKARITSSSITDNATTYSITLTGNWYCSDASGGGTSTSFTANTVTATMSGGTSGTYTNSSMVTWGKGTAVNLVSKTLTVTKTHVSQSKNVTFSISIAPSVFGGTSTVSLPITVTAKPSYTVSFNANGGSGAPSAQTKWYNETLTLSSTKPTKSGYTFLGWSTSSTATSATYSAGGSYTSNSGATLYAIWRKSITVTYNANGGSGAPSAQTGYAYNSATSASITLSSTKPTKTGYTCIGWSTSSTATTQSYNAGTAYSFSSSTTLYAVWRANTVQITYNKNADDATGTIPAQTKTYDQTLNLSDGTGFTRYLYSITSWNTASDGTGTAYDLSQELGATFLTALNLYAQWHLDYIKPTISNVAVFRTDTATSTDESDTGEYIRVVLDYVGGTTDSGVTYRTPRVVVTIDGTVAYSVVQSTGTGSFAVNLGTYSRDSTHTVDVSVYDDDYPTVTVDYSVFISTATYPIDLVSDGDDVYMGVMHVSVSGQALTLAEHYVDGDIFIKVDDTAASGTDFEIVDNLTDLGWIDANGNLT